ncbi:hypothetical protein FQR65_LT15284 [Abscondita terminalis]|nr:hypothetical protein FQR65_LT15284 [Abscondita terminalis]
MNLKYLKFTGVLVAICFCTFVFGQQKFSVSGTVKDNKNGELLIGVTIKVAEDPTISVVANEYGFYSLSLPKGSYTLLASNPGFKDFQQIVNVEDHIKQNILLNEEGKEKTSQIEEVVIFASKKDKNLSSAQMGTETLSIKNIDKLPVLFGEKDVMKTIQLLPGIKNNGEGSSGFSVRGGATDQNLILLDEATVYNASHLLGFFSTFNSDALERCKVSFKGNKFPPRRNNKDYNINGGIGLISSRLSVEGPIQKEKSSFIVSARRTYADIFLKATDDFKDSKLYFYDLNLKMNYQINDNNRLYLSGYFGRDVLEINLDLDNQSGKIVIEGNVTDQDGPYYVKITKSVAFTEANKYPAIENAKVILSDDTGQTESLQLKEKNILHKVTMPELYLLITGAGFIFDPPTLGNRYLFSYDVNKRSKKIFQEFSDNINNGMLNQRPLILPNDDDDGNVKVKAGDTINVEMHCIDQKIYTYYSALLQLSGGGGITQPIPQVISTTEHCIVGFRVSSERKLEDNLKDKPIVDTMEFGTNVCQLSGGRGGRFKSPKLEELSEKLFGHKFDEAHNAAADVNATAQAFFEMMRLEVYPLDKIFFDDVQMKAFKDHNPDVFKPFDIVIRRQVADSKKRKKTVDFGDTDDIDIGNFFHFYSHSIYSTLQATSGLADLVSVAEKNNFPAVGLVDLGNMMGAFKFIDEVEKYNGNLKQKKQEAEAAEEKPDNYDEINSAKFLTPILGLELYISERYATKTVYQKMIRTEELSRNSC